MYGGYLYTNHASKEGNVSVAMSLLAMLADGPRYGYELRAEFDRRTGARWPLNVGQVYKTLDRFEREGLVTRTEATDAGGQVFYDATPEGRDAAARWLSTADPVGVPSRDDLAIKLAVAVTLQNVDIEHLLREQRSAAMTRLQVLTRESGSDPVTTSEGLAARLVSDAALFSAESQVRWLDHVAERVRSARASGIELAVPFETERPRRGRPRRPADSSTSPVISSPDAPREKEQQ